MTGDLSRRAVLAHVIAAGALAGVPRFARANAATVISWYPGLLGSNFKNAFFESYPDRVSCRLVESWDNPRFTQMQANRNNPNVDVATFIDVLLPLVARSGLVEKLTVTAIPNLNDVDPAVAPGRIMLCLSPMAVGVYFTTQRASLSPLYPGKTYCAKI